MLLNGLTQVHKDRSKSESIRLVDSEHEISCKLDGISIALKA